MWYMVVGKVLEFVGAVLMAGTVLRAAHLQLTIGRHLETTSSQPPHDTLDTLRAQLVALLEQRKLQFGSAAALITALGAALFVVGSGLYLMGLLGSH